MRDTHPDLYEVGLTLGSDRLHWEWINFVEGNLEYKRLSFVVVVVVFFFFFHYSFCFLLFLSQEFSFGVTDYFLSACDEKWPTCVIRSMFVVLSPSSLRHLWMAIGSLCSRISSSLCLKNATAYRKRTCNNENCQRCLFDNRKVPVLMKTGGTNKTSYLASFVQKCVPHTQVGLNWNVVDEDSEEPIERKQRQVHTVSLQMRV